jgi:hypothetical protein
VCHEQVRNGPHWRGNETDELLRAGGETMTKQERHLSYWPAEKWVKNWEDSAGKPLKTATATLEYNGKTHTVKEEYRYASNEGIEFMWEEGNWSCDCNKSLMIQRQVDPDFPEMDCGDEIKLVKLEIAGD